jgi:hypothetical protein
MDSAPLPGTSPAPKQGPQKQGLNTAPEAISLACTPLLISSRFTARRADTPTGRIAVSGAAAVQNGGGLAILSYMPPEQPAMTP